MPSKNSVIPLATQPPDGAIQVEVQIPLRPRRPMVSPDAPSAPVAESSGPPRIPRVTRLMALAIKFQDMVDRGEVRDYADLARLGYVSRARLTQIMNLLHLAPDIQEALLEYCNAQNSTLAITERDLREVCRIVDWRNQLAVFGRMNCFNRS
jgi:hypothetical protein